MPTLLAITGPKRAGKTSLCARLVACCADMGLQVGGVLAPDRTENGIKVGSDVIWLRDGQRHALARIVPAGDAATVGEYAFDENVLAATLAALLRDLATSLDLVLLDEIGRLELHQGGGYAPALAAVPQSPARVIVMTVRQSLVATLIDRLAPLSLQVFDVADDPARTLAALLAIVRDATQETTAG